MRKEEPVFVVKEFFLKQMLVRILMLIVITLCVFNYSVNPRLFIPIIVIASLIFLLKSTRRVVVKENYFALEYLDLLSFLYIKNDKYRFDEIRDISFHPTSSESSADIISSIILIFLPGPAPLRIYKKQMIEIDFKSGSQIKMDAFGSEKENLKLVNVLKERINNTREG